LPDARRCHQNRTSLFFSAIVTVGDPCRHRFLANEFDAIFACVPKESDRQLLVTDKPIPAWQDGTIVNRIGWYCKDLNAVLQNMCFNTGLLISQKMPLMMTSDVSVKKKQRIGKSINLTSANFRDGYKRTGLEARRPQTSKIRTLCNAQEIEHGALYPGLDAENHVFAYFRTIKDAPENGSAVGFIDTGRDKDDLEALKIEINGRLSDSHIHQYEANWQGNKPLSDLDAYAIEYLRI